MFIVTECLHCGSKQYVGIEKRKMFPYYILDKIAEQPCPICLNNQWKLCGSIDAIPKQKNE